MVAFYMLKPRMPSGVGVFLAAEFGQARAIVLRYLRKNSSGLCPRRSGGRKAHEKRNNQESRLRCATHRYPRGSACLCE